MYLIVVINFVKNNQVHKCTKFWNSVAKHETKITQKYSSNSLHIVHLMKLINKLLKTMILQ